MDEFLRVEARGLEAVPDQERRGHPRELFFIWAAALADFFSFFAGAVLVSVVGLGVTDSIVVLVLGAVAGALLLGPLGVTGTRTGLPQIVYSRLAFGRRGAYIGGALTLILAVGWFAYDCAIAVYTAKSLPVFGAGPPTWAVLLMLAAMVAGSILVAVFGHRTITLVQTVQAPTFVVLCLVIAAVLAPTFHPELQDSLQGWPRLAAMLFGFTTVFALIVSWVTYAADYSRYLPRRTSGLQVSLYTGAGATVTLVLCGVLGVLVQSIDAKNSNLAALIVQNIPTWLAWAFVVFIVVAEMSSNYLNVYTAGLSALSLGIPLRRWTAALVVGLVGGGVATYVLLQTSFQQVYVQFLVLTYVWFPAWCVVVLFDFWRRRRAGTLSEARWIPGIAVPAVVAFGIGTLITLLFFQEPGFYQGILAHAFFGNLPADISGIAGVVVTLVFCLALLRAPGRGGRT